MTEYKRPNIPYAGEALPNNTRYELLTQNRQPPTPILMDSEMNYLIDSVNDLDHKIKDVEAGAIPGSSETMNKDKLLKTDGEGNLSWILVGEVQMSAGSIGTEQIKESAIVTSKLGNASITTDKIYDQNVTTPKVRDGAITSSKLADSAVIHPKIAQGAIDFSKIALMPSRQRSIVVTANATGQWTTMGTAPNDKSGYYPRSRSNADMHWSRIQASDLDAGVVGEVQLAANAITTPKIADGAVTNSKVSPYTFTYDRMVKNPQKARGAVITTPDGTMNIVSPPDNLGGAFLKSKKDDAPQFEKLGFGDLPTGYTSSYLARWRFNPSFRLLRENNMGGFVTKLTYASGAVVVEFSIASDRFIAFAIAEGYDNISQQPSFYITRSSSFPNRLYVRAVNGDGSLIIYKVV